MSSALHQPELNPLQFAGLDCVEYGNAALSLVLAQSAGPRILSLKGSGGTNLLAELPDVKISVNGFPDYSVYGGHRFWLAPELPAITYITDNDQIEISHSAGSLTMLQNPVGEPAIQKSIELSFPLPDQSLLQLKHKAVNLGQSSTRIAPWAITQLKTGGMAIVPQAQDPFLDEVGLMPNRNLVLWPYSDLTHANFHVENDLIWLRAEMASPFKFGVANPRGWLAYVYEDMVFVKYAAYSPQENYLDFGASTQCYCNGSFLELETLGPQIELAPGASMQHVELWELIEQKDLPLDDPHQLVVELDLDQRAKSRLELLQL